MTESTTYNPENELKVLVHGWLGTTEEKEGFCSYNMKGQSVNVRKLNIIKPIIVQMSHLNSNCSYITNICKKNTRKLH